MTGMAAPIGRGGGCEMGKILDAGMAMTPEEMRAARERGESQSDWKRVHRMVQDGIEPAVDDASPNSAALMRADLVSREHRD